MSKPWGGRFNEDVDKEVEKFTSSISYDKRLAAYDIKGSLAHARSLVQAGVIQQEDFKQIEKGLKDILAEISAGDFIFDPADEDVHMAIEKSLIDKIGSSGSKLHTGRSRNDQVVTDLRMYCRDKVIEILHLLLDLQKTLAELATKNIDTIMPGYTHLQIAQPVLLAHHFLAYLMMFKRDINRLMNLYSSINILPLGAGALSGTAYNINRQMVANELAFDGISENSLDAVSDRDFVIEFISVMNIIMIHLSRFCEEIILWSTKEFGFISLDDSFTTGSSMMPQKKNPDVAELIRGKTGRLTGNLAAISMVMKGLPLSYNRDMQEDKKGLFEAIDITAQSLSCFNGMLQTMKINKDIMNASAGDSFAQATELADYLVAKGMPFRDAHNIIGKIVSYCLEKKTQLSDLSLDEYHKFSELFEESVYQALEPMIAIKKRNVVGGTSPDSVKEQLYNAQKWLDNTDSWIKDKIKNLSL